jgi:C1A family cysteine protease/fibronectin type 3 domain-containing protein
MRDLMKPPSLVTTAVVSLLIVGLLVGAAVAEGPLPATPEQEARLAAIRAAIEETGADWIAEHNAISTLPREEYLKRLGCGWSPEEQTVFDTLRPKRADLERDYPSYWDWRNMGGTTPVKDQGGCGSCWGFAAVGATEGNLRINEGVIYDLSEQQILDCNTTGSSCDGGSTASAYAVLRDPGAVSEEDIPYLAVENTCRQKLYEKIAIIDGHSYIAGNIDSYKAALMNGPISACYTVYEDFNAYGGGCYEYTWGGVDAGHCIVIVGWDDSMCGGEGAWICKNSWGPGWGVAGYFYIKYDECGIGSGAQQPMNAHIRRERLVPDEFGTIQGAMDNSNRGDVIRVAGGTYQENVVVGDYRIIYGGYDPTFEVRDLALYPTIVDADGSGDGFLISNRSNVVVDGFEVANATGASDYGIHVSTSEATIRNCDIHDSETGVRVDGTAVDGEVVIYRCKVRDNTDEGIYVYGADNTEVEVTLTAVYGNGLDGIYSYDSPTTFLGNTIAVNGGDGIDLRSSSGNVIINNITCSNTGYGITCTSATPVNTYNCVWDNDLGDYGGCSTGTGSISEDPVFCDAPGGDVSVHATSPTLGAGQSGGDMGALGIGCPPGPQNLHVAQVGASLELSWSVPPAERADVDYYIVYRDTSQSAQTEIGTVNAPDTTFTDITIPPCAIHNYWVSAVDTEALEGAASNRAYDELCYAGPADLSVTFDEGGNELEWSHGEGSIDLYVIMRSTVTAPAESVGYVVAPDTSYVDVGTIDCPRDNYGYEIAPVYDTGWYGQSSERVDIDPSPSPPQGLSVEWVGSDAVLTWDPNCESDFRRYRVYQDTVPISPPVNSEYLIGLTTDTLYVDEGLNTDWPYFYRVVATDASAYKSKYSEMVYLGEGESRLVPSVYMTIQEAIDAASALDTVLVSPGTYPENVVLKDGVFVASTGGRATTTITSSSAPVVSAVGLCDLTLLSGFTVDGQSTAAKGLDCWESYLRVEDCAFQHCTAGASFQFGGAPAVAGCKFTLNQNGVTVADSSRPFLSGNTFDANTFSAIMNSGTAGPEVGRTLPDANDFLNMGVFQILNTGPSDMDADYNYWGDPCVDPGWFFGSVDYTPWTDAAHVMVLTDCTAVPDTEQDRAHASYNFPNPFNPSTAIRYTVPQPGAEVRISVYDLRGRLVRTLVSEEKGAGEYMAVWRGRDDQGNGLSSGVYFYRIEIGDYRVDRKMILLK